MTNQEINEKLQEIENKLFENTDDEFLTESNVPTLQNDLVLFYQHLIKCVVQPIRIGMSWINSMNDSRIHINKLIVKGKGKRNTNQMNKLHEYIDKALVDGREEAATEIEKEDKELGDICRQFAFPEFFKDLDNFVFNTDRIKIYITENIRNNKYRTLTTNEIRTKEKLINDKLKYVSLNTKYKE